MPSLNTDIYVEATPKTCYQLVSDMERFPEFIPTVDEIKVIERGEGWTISRWVAQFQKRPVVWTERDDFDDEALTIDYDQVEGDLRYFRGQWRFEPEGSGCRIHLSVSASLGVPMLSAALDPLVNKIVRDNAKAMLEAIKSELES